MVAAMAFAVGGLFNCAGDSAGVDAIVERPQQSIRGIVFDAPIADAVVEVYRLDDEISDLAPGQDWSVDKMRLLASTRTDENGAYELMFQAQTGPCLVSAHSGQYTEESSGQLIDVLAEERLWALTQCRSAQDQTLTLSWLTSLAYGYARFLHSSGLGLPEAIDRASQTWSGYTGLDITRIEPTRIDYSENLSPSLDDSLLYGFACAALSRLTHGLSLRGFPQDAVHAQINSVRLTGLAVRDIAFDGLLNGTDQDGLQHIGSVSVDNTIWRVELASALMSLYADTSINRVHDPHASAGTDASDASGGGVDGGVGGSDARDGGASGGASGGANGGANDRASDGASDGASAGGVRSASSGAGEAGDAARATGVGQGLMRIQQLANRLVAPAPFHTGAHPQLNLELPRITVEGIAPDDLISAQRRVRIFISHALPTHESLHLNGVELQAQEPGLWQIDTTIFNDGPAQLVVVSGDDYARRSRLEINFRIENRQVAIARTAPTAGSHLSGRRDIQFNVATGLADIDAEQVTLTIGSRNFQAIAGSDNPSRFTVSVDTATLADGAADIVISAEDSLRRHAELVVSYIIDNTAPVIDISGLDERAWYPGTVPIDIAVVEENINSVSAVIGNENIDLSLLESRPKRWSGLVPVPTLPTGIHELIVTVTDMAGARTTTRSPVRIDSAAPVISLATPATPVKGAIALRGRIDEDNLAEAVLHVGGNRRPDGSIAGGLAMNITNTGLFHVPLATSSPGLSEGVNQVSLTVSDRSGRRSEEISQIIIDNTAPDIRLQAPTGYVTGMATITGRISEANLATAVLRVGAQQQSNGSFTGGIVHRIDTAGPYSFDIDTRSSLLREGSNVIVLTVTDGAGHGAAKIAMLHIDNTAPVVDLDVPAGYTTGLIVIDVRIDEDHIASAMLHIDPVRSGGAARGDGLAWSFANAGPAPVNVDTTDSALTEGENTVRLTVSDHAGNRTERTASLYIDNTKPVISLDLPTDFVAGTVTISGRVDDANIAQAELHLNVGAVDDAPEAGGSRLSIRDVGAFSFTIDTRRAPITEGINTVRLYAVDKAGHRTELTGELKVDNIATAVHLSVPSAYVHGRVTISGRIDEDNLTSAVLTIGDVSSDAIVYNGLRSGPFSFEIDTSSNQLRPGANAVVLTVTDIANRTTTRTAELLIDNTAPQANLDSLPAFVRGQINITGSITEDNLSTAVLYIGATAGTNGVLTGGLQHTIATSGRFSVAVDSTRAPVVEGVNPVHLLVTDKAGQSVEKTTVLTVDNTAPTISMQVPHGSISGTVRISGHIDETNLASAALSVGGRRDDGAGGTIYQLAAAGPWHVDIDTTRLPVIEGANAVRLVVSDQAGHRTVQTGTLQVDNTPPVASLTIPADFVNGIVRLHGNVSDDNLVSAELRIGSSLQPDSLSTGTIVHTIDASGPWQLDIDTTRAPVAEGANAVRLVVIDSAAHRTVKAGTLKVDNIVSAARLDVPPGIVSGRVSIGGQVDENNLDTAVLSIGAQVLSGGGVSGGIIHDRLTNGPFSIDIDTRSQLLTEGINDVILQVSDLGGNTVTEKASLHIDNTAPALTLTVPDEFVSGTIRISGNVTEDNLATAVLTIGVGSAAGVIEHTIERSGPFSFNIDTTRAPLSDGVNAVRLLVTDQAGHSAVETTKLHIDNTAPALTLTVPTEFASGTIRIGGSITEDNLVSATLVIGVGAQINDTDADLIEHTIERSGAFSFAVDTTNTRLTEGLNTVRLVVSDVAGHRVEKTAALRIDNTAPVISLAVPDGLLSGTIKVSGHIDEDNLASASLVVGAGALLAKSDAGVIAHAIGRSGSFSFDIDTTRAPLAEGLNTVRLVVTDSAGHQTQKTAALTIDNIAPVVTLAVPSGFVSGTIRVNGNIDEANLASASLSIGARDRFGDSGADGIVHPIDSRGTFSFAIDTASALLVDGVHTVRLVVSDEAGHRVEKTTELHIDNTAPVVTLTVPEEFVSGTVRISGDITEDNLASATLIIGAGALSEGSNPASTEYAISSTGSFGFDIDTTRAPLAEGMNTVRLVVTDSAGHRLQKTAELWVDNITPVVTLTVPDGMVSGTVHISGIIAEHNLASATLVIGQSASLGGEISIVIEYSIDRSGPYSFVIDTTAIALADGISTVRVMVEDRAGHTAMQTDTVHVDNTAPVISLNFTREFVRDQLVFSGNAKDDNLHRLALCIGRSNSPHLLADCKLRTVLLDDDINLIDGDGSFSLTVSLSDDKIDEGNNTVALVAVDGAGNTTVSREGGFIINGQGGDKTRASVLRVDRLAPVLSLSLPSRWFGAEVVQFTTTVTDANPDVVFVCIGAVIEPAAVDAQSQCPDGLVVAVSQFPEQIHTLDLRLLPAGVRQGRNPVTLYAADRAGHVSVQTRSALQEPGDEVAAALFVDTIAPQVAYRFTPGIRAGLRTVHLEINEEHLASAQLNFIAAHRRNGVFTPSQSALLLELEPKDFVRNNPADPLTATIAFDTTRLADGDYQIQLIANDLAGHRAAVIRPTGAGASVQDSTAWLQIDNTAPELMLAPHTGPTLVPVIAGAHLNQSLTIAGAATDANLASVIAHLYSLDGVETPQQTLMVNLTDLIGNDGRYSHLVDLNIAAGRLALPEGRVRLTIDATDQAGLTARDRVEFVIDTHPPQAVIRLDQADIAGQFTLTVDVDELHLASSRLFVGTYTPTQAQSLTAGVNRFTIDSRQFIDGPYPISINLRDQAGNEVRFDQAKFGLATSAVQAIVRIDNTAPRVELNAIDAHAAGALVIAGSILEGNLANARLHICDQTPAQAKATGASRTIDLAEHLGDADLGRRRFSVSVNTTALPDGPCRISASASDQAGNVHRRLATGAGVRQTLIDNTAPLATITVPTSPQRASFVVSATINDRNLLSAVVRWPKCGSASSPSFIDINLLDPSSSRRTGSTYTLLRDAIESKLTCLGEGRQGLELVVRDHAGNEVRRQASFVRDTIAPQLTLTHGSSFAGLGHYRNSVPYTAKVTDANVTTVSISADTLQQSASPNCSSNTVIGPRTLQPRSAPILGSFPNSRLTDGRYFLCLRARDSAGNQAVLRQPSGTSSRPGGIVIDNTRARAWFGTRPNHLKGTVNIYVAIDETNIHRAELAVHYQSNQRLAKKFTVQIPSNSRDFVRLLNTAQFSDGNYYMILTITEKNGQVTTSTVRSPLSSSGQLDRSGRGSSTRFDIVIDNTAPVINISDIHHSSRRPNNLLNGTITVNATVRETNLARRELRLQSSGVNRLLYSSNSSSNTALRFTFNTTTVADGLYNLVLIATDQAGSSRSDATAIVIDNTAARLSLNNPSSSWQRGTATLSYTVTEQHPRSLELFAGARKITTLSTASNSYRLSSHLVGSGSHTLKLRLTDQFGVVTEARASRTLNIDRTAPQVSKHAFQDPSNGGVYYELYTLLPAMERLRFEFEVTDVHAGFSSANKNISVTYSSHRPSSGSWTLTAACSSVSTTKMRCRSDSLTFADIRALGIRETTVDTCPEGKKFTVTHGLVVRYTVTDAVGNVNHYTHTLFSSEKHARISIFEAFAAGCYSRQ